MTFFTGLIVTEALDPVLGDVILVNLFEGDVSAVGGPPVSLETIHFLLLDETRKAPRPLPVLCLARASTHRSFAEPGIRTVAPAFTLALVALGTRW